MLGSIYQPGSCRGDGSNSRAEGRQNLKRKKEKGTLSGGVQPWGKGCSGLGYVGHGLAKSLGILHFEKPR